MELHQVRYFLAVYEAVNFTRAAERSGVSQPALTAAIKKLEEEVGGPLFHRDRAGVKLSPLGELLLPRLQRIASDHDSVGEIAKNYKLLASAPLRIGILATIGPAHLATRIQSFKVAAPGSSSRSVSCRFASSSASSRKRRSRSPSRASRPSCPTGW